MFDEENKPKPQVETRTERTILLLKPSEVAVIDQWKQDHGNRTRASAMRALIGRGLRASGVDLPNG